MRKSPSQRRLSIVPVVAILGAAFVGAAVRSSASTRVKRLSASADSNVDVLTPLVATIFATPHPVLGADDSRHIAYELQLINPVSLPVTIEKVETVDPATSEVLGVLDSEDVAALMVSLPFRAPPAGAVMGPGGAGFLVMDVVLARDADVPARLIHNFRLSYGPDIPGLPQVSSTGFTEVVNDAPVVLDNPLRGAGWIDLNGCCETLTSHRGAANPTNGAFHLSQRYAIDFLQLDSEGRIFVGPPDELTSYPDYGTDILSTADGVVVRAHDGVPDNTPGSVPPDLRFENVPGNYVVVDIGGGRFAGYGHMQPGSMTVSVGDHVQRGEVLGLLGNSGNSDAPHLHFQVTDGPSFLGSEGLPYEFRKFESVGLVANLEEVFAGGIAVLDPSLSGRFSRRLPLNLQVVSFRPGPGEG